MSVAKADLYEFIRERRSCIVATVSEKGAPEAAHVYVAATPALELIFYTLQTNRECINLRRDPRIAVVIGSDSEQTLQYEGIAKEPRGAELEDAKKVFLEMLPDRAGRFGWPGLTFFHVCPRWIRFSNYDHPWQIDEIVFPDAHNDRAETRTILQRLKSIVRWRAV